jgi:cyclophilin family peptidyl-prolyl cis-trans isomerase
MKVVSKLFLAASFVLFIEGSVSAGTPGKEDKDTLVVLCTRFGEITLALFPETPVHRANFLKLVASGSYDSTTFHRIIKDFMIQGGDPNSKDTNPYNDGMGSFGTTLPAEFHPAIMHVQGALAAARTENPEKRSSDCQFYLVENPGGTHFLDQNYTVYGQTIKGIEVIQRIAEQNKGANDRPVSNIRIWMKLLPMKKEKVTRTFGYDYESHSVKLELKEGER